MTARLSLLVVFFAACNSPEPLAVGETEENLYYDGGSLWPNGVVDVCWEEWNDSDAEARKWVRESVENTWGRVANLSFNNWGPCNWYLNWNPQVRIHISDERPHTVGVGTNMGHQYNGLVLNFTYMKWPCSGAEICDRYIAAHEFGHVLGFKHEQMRPDTPATCTQEGARSGGATMEGPYDPNSIMNYCAPSWNNNGQLSPEDIAAVQRLYGRRTNSLLSFDARCATAPVNGGYVGLQHCSGAGSQQWAYWPTANHEMQSPNGCLDVAGANSTPGTPLVSWSCDGLSNQHWTLDSVAIRGLGSLCLQPTRSAYLYLPPVMRLQTCDGSSGQSWTLTDANELRNSSGSCLQVHNGSTADHTTVEMAACNGSAAQKFSLDAEGRLLAIGGKCLRATNVWPTVGMNVETSTCSGGLEELWSFSGHMTSIGGNCLHTGDSTLYEDTGPLLFEQCFTAPAETFHYWP